MDDIKTFISGFNIQTIISLTAIIWYFSKEIKEDIDTAREATKEQAKRTDRLYEMFIDLLKNKQ